MANIWINLYYWGILGIVTIGWLLLMDLLYNELLFSKKLWCLMKIYCQSKKASNGFEAKVKSIGRGTWATRIRNSRLRTN